MKKTIGLENQFILFYFISDVIKSSVFIVINVQSTGEPTINHYLCPDKVANIGLMMKPYFESLMKMDINHVKAYN